MADEKEPKPENRFFTPDELRKLQEWCKDKLDIPSVPAQVDIFQNAANQVLVNAMMAEMVFEKIATAHTTGLLHDENKMRQITESIRTLASAMNSLERWWQKLRNSSLWE